MATCCKYFPKFRLHASDDDRTKAASDAAMKTGNVAIIVVVRVAVVALPLAVVLCVTTRKNKYILYMRRRPHLHGDQIQNKLVLTSLPNVRSQNGFRMPARDLARRGEARQASPPSLLRAAKSRRGADDWVREVSRLHK